MSASVSAKKALGYGDFISITIQGSDAPDICDLQGNPIALADYSDGLFDEGLYRLAPDGTKVRVGTMSIMSVEDKRTQYTFQIDDFVLKKLFFDDKRENRIKVDVYEDEIITAVYEIRTGLHGQFEITAVALCQGIQLMEVASQTLVVLPKDGEQTKILNEITTDSYNRVPPQIREQLRTLFQAKQAQH